MKRTGGLFQQIVDLDNVALAFYKARKGKHDRKEVLDYTKQLVFEFASLLEQLSSGVIKWGVYHQFRVCDPKPRLIHAAPFRDRVAHHGIMNICEPIFERYQIDHSYACRKGRGLMPL